MNMVKTKLAYYSQNTMKAEVKLRRSLLMFHKHFSHQGEEASQI